MRKLIAALIALLCLTPAASLAAEGDPLLSVDDLLTLESSYRAFLGELGDLIVARGLLSEEERSAWLDVEMGDFYQNGGYGSILASYMPGMLGYVREEDTLRTLRCALADGMALEASTMRRYTPQDSSLPGLMLTLTLTDAQGVLVDAVYRYSAPSGLFLKWDSMAQTYVSVGASAVSDGETVVWSDQTPAENALNPVITITIEDAQTQEPLAGATLELTVDGMGFLLTEDALSADAP